MSDIWNQRLGVWWIAEDHPDTVAIAASPEGASTYGELTGFAHRIVRALRAAAVEPGGIVAILSPNGVWPIRLSLACQEAGWQFLLVNAYLTGGEVATMFEHAAASMLVVHPQLEATLDGEADDRIRSAVRVMPLAELEHLAAQQPSEMPIDRSEGGMIAYSSGTTGAPKAISRPGSRTDPSVAANRAAIFGRAFDFRPFDGPHLVSTAMYHGGSHAYYMGALHVGHALVIMARFDAERTLALIAEHRVRTAYMVPTQFHRMLQLPDDVKARYDLSSLHAVVHSAAPCPRITKERMMAWWGPVIWETYGGMEGAATIAKPQRWMEKPGTVGRAVRGVRLSILDDTGHELGPNQTGQIYYETENGFAYHRDAELTKRAHVGRQFTIGDIGYVDDDGYLFIQDRAKDMIISGGVNIFPTEIEAVLLEHPAVGDAGVIGIPDDDWGELVLAVVQPSDGSTGSDRLAAELIAHCAEHLAAYKRPRRVEFRTELPRTDAGKLYKRAIRDEYWKAVGRAV